MVLFTLLGIFIWRPGDWIEAYDYGRILSQTVMPMSTLAVPNPRKVVGFCYTPQDGNSLLSSVAATLRYLDANKLEERMDVLRPYIFREI